jgi:penicillin-binding protein 1A
MLQGARRRGFVILGTLALALAALAGVGALVLALAAAWYWPQLPPLDKVTSYRPHEHLQVFSSEGIEIGQFGSERRIFVPVADVPRLLKDAVLAVEDAQFYEHGGISWRGLARAVFANLGGGMPQGASTITQQVARTFFLSMRRTPERKIKEALLALQIESRLTKDQILELYLNQIYLGQRSYGFAAAAQAYFGKTLAELDLAETALLAGLPQNPIHANPMADLERARARQRVVLARMLAVGLIDEQQRDRAAAASIVLRPPRSRALAGAEHVAEMARQAVVERLGERAYTEGIRVMTSIRVEDQRAAFAGLRRAVLAHARRQPWRGPEQQESLPQNPQAAERAIAQALKDARDDDALRNAIVLAASPRELSVQLASGETVTVSGEGLRLVQAALAPKARPALAVRRGSLIRVMAVPAAKPKSPPVWTVVQWPEADGALVTLEPASGRIRALVGGFDFGRSPFNRVTSAWRQPGSAFKPFVYSAAFETGVMPETRVDDLPLVNADGSALPWSPTNSDGSFEGEMSVRDALVKSKNPVSVRLLQHTGVDAAREWIARFGFDPAKHPQDLTLALGSGSVTPLQMAAAYAVFANGGHRVTPVLIERIVDARGQVLFEAPPAPVLDQATRAIPERNAFLVGTLLADVTRRGTAARAQAVLRRTDLYGKTGTTNDAIDAWFAGFQSGLVAVAWMGHDDPKSLGERESGAALALPMWIDAMARALRGVPVRAAAPPAGVVAAGDDWRYAEWAEGGFVARIGGPAGGGPFGWFGNAPAAAAATAPVDPSRHPELEGMGRAPAPPASAPAAPSR